MSEALAAAKASCLAPMNKYIVAIIDATKHLLATTHIVDNFLLTDFLIGD